MGCDGKWTGNGELRDGMNRAASGEAAADKGGRRQARLCTSGRDARISGLLPGRLCQHPLLKLLD